MQNKIKKFYKEGVTLRLVDMASTEQLDCFFVHGADSYILVEDILEEFSSFLFYYRKSEKKEFSLFEQELIEDFEKVFEENFKNILKSLRALKSKEEFIFNDPYWQKVHEKAKEILEKLGFDLKKWEDENIDWRRVGLERPERYKDR